MSSGAFGKLSLIGYFILPLSPMSGILGAGGKKLLRSGDYIEIVSRHVAQTNKGSGGWLSRSLKKFFG